MVHARPMIGFLALLLATLRACLRARSDLVLENLLLRHQPVVAGRPRRRPRLRTWDRLL